MFVRHVERLAGRVEPIVHRGHLIALTMRPSLVMAVAHDMFATTFLTANALRPAHLTYEFETFRIIEHRRQIDRNADGSNFSRIGQEPNGFS